MSLNKKIKNFTVLIKEIYDYFLIYIDDSDAVSEEDYINLIQIIDKSGIQQKKEVFNHFIGTMITVSNHHHRQLGFFDKIERILIKYQDFIKQNNTNNEIYELFESNKRLLYFLIKEKILILDEEIIQLIKSKPELNGTRFSDFFLNDIDIDYHDNEILEYYSNHLDEYEEKRRIGENDSYICSLIRQDSIEEFVSYVNRTNFSLSSTINPSIFETNIFLIKKEITLIEYAAFFGSIQIFQYLYRNGVELSISLWLYAVHSNNPNFFLHYIEEKNVPYDSQTYETCLYESIKCHHNEFANYIQTNKLKKIIHKKVFETGFQFSNYSFFTDIFYQNDTFFNLCQHNYITVVNLLLESRKSFIEFDIICIE